MSEGEGPMQNTLPVRPKLTLITATFNCVRTLAEAFDSLDRQSYNNIEHVVIDGGSTDGTLALIQARARAGLCVYVSEPDAGIYDALNKGVRKARGDVIGFLHADDLFNDSAVLEDVARAFRDDQTDVVYGDLVYVDALDTNKVVRYWRSRPFQKRLLRWGWMPPHPTCFMRSRIYEECGKFDASFRIAGDYEHILRVFSRSGLKSIYLPRVMVQMRVGGVSNRSLRNVLRKMSEDWSALRRHHQGGVFTVLVKNLSKVGQLFFRRVGSSGKVT